MKPNLDVMRAFAVLLVLVNHLANLFQLPPDVLAVFSRVGRFGVLIFFVHTSIVLFWALERITGRHRWLPFYVRRAFRIYPLSVVTIAVVVLGSIPPYAWPTLVVPLPPDTRTTLTNLALVQNLTGNRDVLVVMWSLPFEVQMYSILPLLHWACRNRSRATLVTLWAGVAVTALALIRLDWSPVSDAVVYVPCFTAGIVAVAWPSTARFPGWTWPAFLLALTCLFAALDSSAVGVPATFRYEWWMCALIGATVMSTRDLKVSTFTRAAHLVAKYSYGIYLSHVPLMWLAFVAMAGQPLVSRWGVFLGGLAVVPVAAFHLIEKPAIDFGVRLTSFTSGTPTPAAVQPV